MENTLVVYDSRHGAAKSYAETLAKELNVKIYPVKKLKKKDIEKIDTLIIGGSIYMSKLRILKKLKKHQDTLKQKTLYLFAVGLHDDLAEGIEKVKKDNTLLELYPIKQYFYFPGKLILRELKFPYRTIMKFLRAVLSKQENLKEEEAALLHEIKTQKDKRDMTLLEPLITLAKG